MEYKVGDVLKADRGLYYHYGIYVGNNQVVHFSGDKSSGTGFLSEMRGAEIIKTSFSEFAKGDLVRIDTQIPPKFSGCEIAHRANGMIGKLSGEYNLLFNNCEHFANWCRAGENYSKQSSNYLDLFLSDV